ncbi:hypothetical protein AgCh_036425 [Apium graveolens]
MDTSIYQNLGMAGAGIIARNHDGHLILEKSICSLDVMNPTLAEAMAVKEALRWAMKMGWSSVTIKSDCMVVTDSDTHYIDFEVEDEQVGRWRYTGYYGCLERGRRRFSWEILSGLAGNSTLPWCILGDFNDMTEVGDKRGGREQPLSLLTSFSEAINDYGLMDMGFNGKKYTCEKSRGKSNWTQERLDRAFINQLWRDLFPQAELRVMDVSTSDHLATRK